ncbi:MAG: hypothetical protein C0392_14020 [Syntrophus sp. (in: bacteria)]|nr:hypothetical protein [Syntrophus sp. (in: bacteria)]
MIRNKRESGYGQQHNIVRLDTVKWPDRKRAEDLFKGHDRKERNDHSWGHTLVTAIFSLLFCAFVVPEVIGQVFDHQKTTSKDAAQEQHTPPPAKTTGKGDTLPWKGPVFSFMDRLTRDSTDTSEHTPPNKARYEYNHIYQKNAQSSNPGGQSITNQQILRMDFPVTSKFTFRTDIPYVWNSGNANGIGDIDIKLKYRIHLNPHLQLYLLSDFYFPTGAQPITAGKWQAGPGFEVDATILPLRSVARFKIQEFFSYGGNSCYTSINYTQAEGGFYTLWSDNWWTELTFDLIVNWEPTAVTARGKTGAKLELEIGRQFGEHLRAYIKPGAGLWGIGQPNIYDWFLRAGVYYLF